jgi:hypothetical protein
MPIDFNRIRQNTALSDQDAFKYYRQYTSPVLTQPESGNRRSRPGFLKRSWNNRPIMVVSVSLCLGLAAGYALIKYNESPTNGDFVYQTIDKLKAEFAEYEASLRRA